MNKVNDGEAFGVAQSFILELHDKTLFPAEYYKQVIYYLFDVLRGKKSYFDNNAIPKEIWYSEAVKKYAKFNSCNKTNKGKQHESNCG